MGVMGVGEYSESGESEEEEARKQSIEKNMLFFFNLHRIKNA